MELCVTNQRGPWFYLYGILWYSKEILVIEILIEFIS